MHFNNDIYTRFIKFGKVTDESERQKMVDIIKEWQFTPLEQSNIDKKYLDSINAYVTDSAINDMLALYPHLKDGFVSRLFELLGTIDKEVANSPTFAKEYALIEEYSDFKVTIIKPAKSIISRSEVLDSKVVSSYYQQLDALKNTERNQKFAELKSAISDNWQALIKENNSTAMAKQLQTLNNNSEQELKNKFDNLTVLEFSSLWSKWNEYKTFLKENYYKRQFDLNHYKKQFESIKKINTNQNINPSQIGLVKNQLIEDWNKALKLKELQQSIQLVDETRKSYLEELYKKIEELKELLKLLSPFLHETTNIGRLWDMSAGNWQNVNFNLLEKYAQILESKKEIQELADLLGKCRKAEAEIEEEEFKNIIEISRYKVEHNGKAELVGITESDDLNNLLPAELALFSDLETESIFYKRFAEKKLQTFQYVDKSLDMTNKAVNDTRQKEVEKDKGPFIIAVDTSGSMQGSPEFLAKVIAFAITRIAISEKRKAFLISFSTNITTFELTDIQNSLEKLIEFLQMSFYGGTDVSDAVIEALEQMQTENYEQADLLIISDGVFAELDNDTIEVIEGLKEQGNKFNALMIGSSYNKRALNFCDNIWQYDPYYDEMKDLIRDIKAKI